MDNLLRGRRIWVDVTLNGIESRYSTQVVGVKKFLPRGPVASEEAPSYDGIRTEDLIQLFTDTGIRTLAVASISLSDPGRKRGNS